MVSVRYSANTKPGSLVQARRFIVGCLQKTFPANPWGVDMDTIPIS